MLTYSKRYDVLVVGGGHAGIEAALAATRIGCQTLLITTNIDSIGRMSCNPAIGGLAKGHIVREIDSLGGQMALTTDSAGIQFRMLNRGRGEAVQAPRAQCDKRVYQSRMRLVCERAANLDVTQSEVTALLVGPSTVHGVMTSIGVKYESETVVVTTGTFLRGVIHIGHTRSSGGRACEFASNDLSSDLKQMGFEVGRMKTGTPPRLLSRSIDWSRTQAQHGDEPPPLFSHWSGGLFHVEQSSAGASGESDAENSFPPGSVLARIGHQVPCHITYTTGMTARVVKDNIHRSPLYSGIIEGIGPRYCPSIEDKILRFKDKDWHQVFLEPEGIDTDEVYVNGLSTSLPFDVQIDLVRSVVGCEEASILRPGYAVEYDYIPPVQLHPSLETKLYRNLFFAGQINGTSGYEEAGAQGLIAGINAARRVMALPLIVLGRNESYIGVLIDDLVTKGTNEPYRMFTSRAEFRLILRQDNADLRLSKLGFEVGLLPKPNYERVQKKADAIAKELTRLASTRCGSATFLQILRRPEVRYADLPSRDERLSAEVIKQVEIEVKYSGYIARQEHEIERLRGLEGEVLPGDLDYEVIPNLRSEARQKLAKIRPTTVGQAARISGVSPADVGVLTIWLRRTRLGCSAGQTAGAGPQESIAREVPSEDVEIEE